MEAVESAALQEQPDHDDAMALSISIEEPAIENTNQIDEAADGSERRQGTTSSARFNILSTMVGGGSLSLPLAFQKTGNALLGPIFLIVTAAITEFCFRALIASARTVNPVSPDQDRRGRDSYEAIAAAAFGKRARVLSTILVTAMCFFGIVAYAVLLRDMLLPISELIFHSKSSGPTLANNMVMLTIVLAVTPLCTLKTLTALKPFGAASMLSVLVLGSCIVYRSIQCSCGALDTMSDRRPFHILPATWKDVLDVFPIFVSCYVCHYNIPTVHNELRNPTQRRVNWWIRSTTWLATGFYMIMGIAGSAYAPCTSTGAVHGNVLLDFRNDDPLLLVGRMCLAFTITMAFPMLTIPARDILLLQSIPIVSWSSLSTWIRRSMMRDTDPDALDEPLLADEEQHQTMEVEGSIALQERPSSSFGMRLLASVSIFWTAAVVASCVSSIDIVWKLLGSSLSIFMSYLIPCGSYVVISNKFRGEGTGFWKELFSKILAWILIVLFIPLGIVSTANAVRDTFFAPSPK